MSLPTLSFLRHNRFESPTAECGFEPPRRGQMLTVECGVQPLPRKLSGLLISNDFIKSKAILGIFGLFLTILTIVASILKPYERCISAADVLIILSDWKIDLIVNWGNIESELDEVQRKKSFYELLQRKDQEISKVGEAMMENLILKGISVQGSADREKS